MYTCIYISHFCLHQACLASRKKKNREIQREREREKYEYILWSLRQQSVKSHKFISKRAQMLL